MAVKDSNFYYYPLKDIEPARDAFQHAYDYLFYQPFNEPNLSTRPQLKETFRLTYGEAFGKSVVISLTEDLITVKEGSPSILYIEDTYHLSAIEKFHLQLLQRKYPIDTAGKQPFMKRYLDSLAKLYPQLLDPAYYHKLYEKTIVRNVEKFTYPVTRISITKQQYSLLIEQINTSGFWAMPYQVNCEYETMDGWGFTLEANTRKKYKIVSTSDCSGDTTKFTKACQSLIELAKMDKEISLIVSGEIETVIVPDIELKDVELKPIQSPKKKHH